MGRKNELHEAFWGLRGRELKNKPVLMTGTGMKTKEFASQSSAVDFVLALVAFLLEAGWKATIMGVCHPLPGIVPPGP